MRMQRAIWIPVVTGLIKKGDQILLGKRPEGYTLAGQWEFPGGKIELGETPEEALARELSEELGIDAQVGNLRLAHTHRYGEKGVLLLFFDVPFWKGEPKTKHHEALDWFRVSDIEKMEIPEANRKIWPTLRAILTE
ncbi:MAG: 8-oxo-dGTP diphosphatase MutT [Bdellovibrionales bacterium CG10_big_fil_rev_8_21_14_0_10_45_34]|nr:MAG: 8-oxo-dGTP diphosphatase MutT [Bdellovibrionales bacterium CG10_big_fil_rev_8_21_14_0_10_45_34]